MDGSLLIVLAASNRLSISMSMSICPSPRRYSSSKRTNRAERSGCRTQSSSVWLTRARLSSPRAASDMPVRLAGWAAVAHALSASACWQSLEKGHSQPCERCRCKAVQANRNSLGV